MQSITNDIDQKFDEDREVPPTPWTQRSARTSVPLSKHTAMSYKQKYKLH